MKKRKPDARIMKKLIGILFVLCILCITACSSGITKKSNTDGETKDLSSSAIKADTDGETKDISPSEVITPPLVLPAKDGTVLQLGCVVEGVFNEDRSILCISCEEQNGKKVVCVDGEQVLELSSDTLVKLYDMCTADAFLELLVGKEEKGWFTGKAYRIKTQTLEEICFLPVRENNTFTLYERSGSRGWYFDKEGIVEMEDATYRLNRSGYLVKTEAGYGKAFDSRVVPILVNGTVHKIPVRQITINENNSFAVAFEESDKTISTPMATAYRVYRSMDGGLTWEAAADDIEMALAELEGLYILDDATAIARWEISGVTGQRMVLLSEDGGLTWNTVQKESVYGFLLSE